MLKKTLAILFFVGLLNSSNGQNQKSFVVHSLSNAIGFTLEGGLTYSSTDFRTNKIDYLGRGLIEFFFYSNSIGTFGLRLYGGLSYLGGKDGVNIANDNLRTLNVLKTRIYFLGGGYSYTLMASKILHPYIFVGLSYVAFEPRTDNNVNISTLVTSKFEKQDINYESEIGLRFLIHENFSLNFSGAFHYNPSDNLDGIWGNNNNDFYYSTNFGISYYFLYAKDSDGDGVDDSEDRCPNTPQHIRVDKFGCPLDSDNDGVPDNKDICPDTRLSVVVDENGCPIDIDKDGIPDSFDKCLHTPANVKVDENGCPQDNDNDGVPDYLDTCPNTPQNVEVDDNGCPIDSDKDGIPDYMDKCPGTPFGQKVNSLGCIIKDNEALKHVNKFVINKFKFGKTDIPESAIPLLKKFILYLKMKPETRWKIVGYTDNLRSYAENYILSLKRAKSVLSYFLKNGIDRKRFKVIGMSYLQPVADNELEYGRSLNRRVEIILLDNK